MASSLNKVAQTLKALHKPGHPLVLANVYDLLSARALAPLPAAKALATASWGVAKANGLDDDDLDLETNLATAKRVALVARENNKPLTVDFQDGYGDKLEEGIARLIEAGVAGINLEDCDKEKHQMYTPEEATTRVKRAVDAAATAGVPDFVINARCDTLVNGGGLQEVILRGKQYLAACATTVFVWGGSRGVSKTEVQKLVEEFGGRLNVLLKFSPDGLTTKELAEIGVARISIGPTLQLKAMAAFKQEAEKILS